MKLTATVEHAAIDLLESELVVELSIGDEVSEIRTPLDELFGDDFGSGDEVATTAVPVDSIDCSEAREIIADRAGVDADAVLITETKAPNRVAYQIDERYV